MKTSQSFGVHFTIKKEKAKDGVTNVYTSITVNKERIRLALKHYVNVENWDAGRGGLKVKVPEAKETNANFRQRYSAICFINMKVRYINTDISPGASVRKAYA